ncbi:MAG: phosphoribosyltransferase family protein [Phycisphaerales bacterium]
MPKTTVLIPRAEIARRVEEMGRALTAELEAERETLVARNDKAANDPVVLVPVLTGAMLFVADLIRHMPIAMSIRPVTLSSYPGAATTSQGIATPAPHSLPADLKGKRLLVLDDIYDSGQTLGLLQRMFAAQHPLSLRTAVLLTKRKENRTEEVPITHSGFTIDDHFVVGYGLDYDGQYRNLPDVCVLDLKA